jgi:hypothetical protein
MRHILVVGGGITKRLALLPGVTFLRRPFQSCWRLQSKSFKSQTSETPIVKVRLTAVLELSIDPVEPSLERAQWIIIARLSLAQQGLQVFQVDTTSVNLWNFLFNQFFVFGKTASSSRSADIFKFRR